MTGFARSQGASGGYAWAWEIKSVNSKGMDLRLRIPPGWDGIEAAVRKLAVERLSRGTVYANLTIDRRGASQAVRINEDVLFSVLSAIDNLKGRIDATVPTLDGILALKGVMEVGDEQDDPADRERVETAVVADFGKVLGQLVAMRQDEGAVLGKVLNERLATIADLTARADAAPGRKPDAVKARLAAQIATLLEAGGRFDSDRLHQEALMLAAKADIREELDRLVAHVAQAQKLLAAGGAVGRKLDFLAQELNREANTLTAKSNDSELTGTGLELKAVVEQFREQIQNLE